MPRDQLSDQSIRLFAIFVFTIGSIITKFCSMGQSSIIALTLCVLTKTLTFKEAFSGLQHSIVWLIVIAFFIAKGFVKTGLGLRLAYYIMYKFGKKTLGLGYGIALTDLIIAPVIPSMTARSGGVIFPIVNSLDKAFRQGGDHHPNKIGAYLIQTAFQVTNITGAMFLTAMAGNPLIVDLASQFGIIITWDLWFKAGFVPGMICFLLIPLLLYIFYPPEIKTTKEAPAIAKAALKELGPIKKEEWFLISTFLLMLGLWIIGPKIQLDPTVAAMIGLIFLLLTHVLTWEELITEKSAWDTLIWFSTLVMMATFLNQFGLMKVLSASIAKNLIALPFLFSFLSIVIIYFYSHYFFASNVAHIGALFPAFIGILIDIQTPPYLAAFILAFSSNLFGCLTHYGSGPAPILFGSGFVKLNTWWKIGFFMSCLYLFIYLVVGGFYWKTLGLF